MTREEAIEIIECGEISNRWGKDGEEVEKMAIEALKQEPCEDCISRQKVNILVDELARAISDERCCMPRGRSTGAIMQDILDLPPVTPQEPCSNCCNGNQIEKAKLCQKSYLAGMEHKQEQFDDTILTLTKTLTKRVVTQVTEDMDNFIFTTIKPWCEAKEQREISKRDLEQALTQYFGKEPCEDAISRQAAIDAIKNYASMLWEKYHEPFPESTIMEMIQELPPVTPQLKTRWIPVSERLPEDFGTYLITLEGGDVCKCEFNPDFIDEEHENGAFTYYHQYFDQATLGMIDEEEEAVDAIAWMPFEPYKAEGSETE